jgi:hypothetical protein
MKFQKFGRIVNPHREIEMEPLKIIGRSVYKRLNFLLGYLLGQDPEIQRKFVATLESELHALVQQERLETPPDVAAIVEQYPNLEGRPELVNLLFNFFLQLLGIPVQQLEKCKVPNRNNLRSFLVPNYHYALALSQVVGKEKAVHLLKEFVEQYTISVADLVEKVPDLDTMRAENLKDAQENPDTGWVFTLSEVVDGKCMFINHNCLWIEALDDCQGPDLLYAVCCHGDFQYAKMQNEHFVMTRRCTIAQGDPYCDKVLHDTRINTELTHPSKEFLDSVVEGDSMQAVEEENIRKTLEIFVKGLGTLDYDKISQAFYKQGQSIGVTEGQIQYVLRDHWKDMGEQARAEGKDDSNATAQYEIKSLQVIGNAAAVIVDLAFGTEDEITERYTDFLHMLRVGEKWVIVNKIYPTSR